MKRGALPERTMRTGGKVLLWLAALVLMLVILAELAIVGGVVWLHSGSGQGWMQRQLAAATAGSGYTVDFTGLSYRFPQGAGIKTLSVSDPQGEFVTARDVVIRPGFLPLAAKRLSLSLHFDELTLSRLPRGKQSRSQQGGAARGITVPDLYFKAVELDDLDINRLVIGEKVAGTKLVLAPKIRARVTLGDQIATRLKARIGQKMDAPLAWLPKKLAFSGTLDPRTLALQADHLALAAPLFEIESNGTVDFIARTVDLGFKGQARTLARLSPSLAGSVAVSGRISGALDNPAVSFEAQPKLDLLKERGLAAVGITATAHDLPGTPQGHVSAQATYKKRQIRLAADFIWQSPLLSLASITGNAPSLTLSGAVDLNTESMLAQGSAQIAAGDFAAYKDLLGIDVAGSGAIRASLSPEDGRQAAFIAAHLQNLAYGSMAADKIDLTAHLPTLKTPMPEEGTLTVSGLQVSDQVRFDSLSATATREEGAYRLSVQGDGKALRDFTLKGGANVAGAASGLPSLSDIDLKVEAGGADIVLNGMMNPKNLDLALKADKFALAALPVALPPNFQSLTLSGAARLNGPLSAPVGNYSLTFSPLAISGLDFNLALTGDYRKNVLTAALKGTGTGIRDLSGSATLPLELSVLPFSAVLSEGRALSGGIMLDADAHALSAAFLSPDHLLTGDLRGQLKLAGSPANPDIGGTLGLTNGSYTYQAYDLTLHDLNVQAAVAQGQIRVTGLSANDGEKGTLTGKGVVSLQQPQQTALSLQATDFHLLHSERADGYASADLSFTGQVQGYLLAGDVTAGPLNVVIPERFQTDIPKLNIVKKGSGKGTGANEALKQISLDVTARADNRIFVRGWGLDAELGGKVAVTGTLDRPEFNGMLKAVRGQYEEFGRRFDIAKAELRFEGTSPPSPYLDIKATTELEDIAAAVTLTGTLGNPSIGFGSVPSLPEDEVLARILFGRDMQSITPFQAVQLKQTLDRFRGKGGGFDPLAQLRNLTGIDEIRVEEGEEGGTSVGVGKYLTDNVYLQLEKGAEGTGGASVDIELSPHITAESKIGENAEAGAGISWRWDY